MQPAFKLLVLLIFIHLNSFAQYPDWITYTNGKQINYLVREGTTIWAGTSGGLVKLDTVTKAFTVYTKQNSGLPSIYINCILIDSIGNKWIGTDNGLAKYDGVNWTVYNQSNSQIAYGSVLSLCIDKSNSLWIGFSYGANKFDGTNWTFYDDTNSPINSSSDINSIACDSSGNIWMGLEDAGLLEFDGTNWTSYNQSNSGIQNDFISDIKFDKNGVLWCASSPGNGTGGLIKFDGATFTVYNTGNSQIPSNVIGRISIDPFNNVWMTSFSPPFIMFDGSTFNSFNSYSSQYQGDLSNIIADSDAVWYCAYEVGLQKFDKVSSYSFFNTSAYNIIDNNTGVVAIDNFNNVWLSSGVNGCTGNCFGSEGVQKFDGTNFTTYNTSNSYIPTNSITNIVVDAQNSVWAGTYGSGLIKFDGNSWKGYPPSPKSGLGYIINGQNTIAFDDSGNVWVCFDSYSSGGGLGKFDGTNWAVINVPYGPLVTWPYCVAIDHRNNLWVLSYGEISKFDGSNWTTYDQWNSLLPEPYLSAIAVDINNNVWVGTNDSGLIEINDSTFALYNTSNSNLPSDNITSLSVDVNNNLWIGQVPSDSVSSGITRYDGVNFTIYNNTNSGLSTNFIQQVVAVGNNIYVTSNYGLTSFPINTTVGINNYNANTKVSNLLIYPNPAGNQIAIDLSSVHYAKPAKLFISNMLGQTLCQSEIKDQRSEVDVSYLSAGMYFVEVVGENEKWVGKFVKE